MGGGGGLWGKLTPAGALGPPSQGPQWGRGCGHHEEALRGGGCTLVLSSRAPHHKPVCLGGPTAVTPELLRGQLGPRMR